MQKKWTACQWLILQLWGLTESSPHLFPLSLYFSYPRVVCVWKRERERETGETGTETKRETTLNLHPSSKSFHFISCLFWVQHWDWNLSKSYEREAFRDPPSISAQSLKFPSLVVSQHSHYMNLSNLNYSPLLGTFFKWPKCPCALPHVSEVPFHTEEGVTWASHA